MNRASKIGLSAASFIVHGVGLTIALDAYHSLVLRDPAAYKTPTFLICMATIPAIVAICDDRATVRTRVIAWVCGLGSFFVASFIAGLAAVALLNTAIASTSNAAFWGLLLISNTPIFAAAATGYFVASAILSWDVDEDDPATDVDRVEPSL